MVKGAKFKADSKIAEFGIRIADYSDGETRRRGDGETFDEADAISPSPLLPLSPSSSLSVFRIPQSVLSFAAVLRIFDVDVECEDSCARAW
jgi:hypothetical protein